MKEQPVLTVESNVEPHSIDLTMSLVYSALNWTTMEPAPERKVRLRFSSGDYLTADREGLKRAIRDLLSRERGGMPARLIRDARDLLDKELAGVQEIDHGTVSGMTAGDLLAMEEPEPEPPLMLDHSEAMQVADLAEKAGFGQTASLLRRLCDRAGNTKWVLLEDLVGPKDRVRLAWQTLQWNDLDRSRRLFLRRQLQKLGGMDGKELRSPEIYDEVVRSLRKDHGLSPNAFWNSIDHDGRTLYKSDERGQEVLKHQDNQEHGISRATLRRYFTRARRSLPSAPQRAERVRPPPRSLRSK